MDVAQVNAIVVPKPMHDSSFEIRPDTTSLACDQMHSDQISTFSAYSVASLMAREIMVSESAGLNDCNSEVNVSSGKLLSP